MEGLPEWMRAIASPQAANTLLTIPVLMKEPKQGPQRVALWVV
jgi:hypothetical protein